MSVERKAVAVRAWTTHTRAETPAQYRQEHVDLGPSDWVLIIDTETTVDLAQSLRFGTYQIRRKDQLVDSGIFYDPDGITSAERAAIKEHAAHRRLGVMTARTFITKVLMRYAWKRRALVVGFNLPFDLSRLAIYHGPARPRGRDQTMRGGFSYAYSADRRVPRIQIKKIGPRAAFIRFATPKGRQAAARNRERGGNVANHRGYFVDVATLAAALLSKKLTLARLADLLETNTRKIDWPDHNTTITPAYLEYAMTDVQVHWECFTALRDRYVEMQLPTPIHRVYSEASIAKAHLAATGIKPWRDVQTDTPDWLVSILMETYAGGRTECQIRRQPISGALIDFTSEYPTSFVLQGLHRFLVADGFDTHELDVNELRARIASLSPKALFDQATWKELAVVVLVAPDDDQLPTRARFNAATWNLGVQRRHHGPSQWFTLADCIASQLATGRTPTIIRALLFRPRPIQTGLQPIHLAGDPNFAIDPTTDDLIRRAVELRAMTRHDATEAEQQGDGVRAERLRAIAGGLKITTNAFYGMTIEINVNERARSIPVTLHLPDRSSFTVTQRRVEEPGKYFHPLLATLIAAGGRLLLGLAMRLVTDLGATYAMCDTDSLFVATSIDGEPDPRAPHIPIISIRQLVEHIIKPFEALNPYDAAIIPGSILELKDVNTDPANEPRVVSCYAIASKRYCIFETDDAGPAHILTSSDGKHRSEHGLGHVLPPLDDDADWIDQTWEQLVSRDLGINTNDPPWIDQPTFGRLTITTPADDRLFQQFNMNKPYREQIRPFGFALVAYRHQLERTMKPEDGTLLTAYTRDLLTALNAEWVVRNGSDRTYRIRTGRGEYGTPGTIAVQTFRDLVGEYRLHPETKAADADGQPCSPATHGILQARLIEASELERIGKEANRLSNGDPIDGSRDRGIAYSRAARACCFCRVALVGRQRIWCCDAHRKRSGRRVGS